MNNIFQLQQDNGIEQYIKLSCDLSVDGNVISAVSYEQLAMYHSDLSTLQLLREIGRKQFSKRAEKPILLSDLAAIKTTAFIEFISVSSRKGWIADPLYPIYSKFSGPTEIKAIPPTFVHSGVLEDYFEVSIPPCLYSVDGMRRTLSFLEEGMGKIPVYVLVRRKDLHLFITPKKRDTIFAAIQICDWFKSYQEIIELNFGGERNREPRYTEIYDFSILKDKTVVDFGGNIGQAAIEAYFNGAKRICNFEVQKCAVRAGRYIGSLFCPDVTTHIIDFNSPDFEADVLTIISKWDWAIFQAIYRTKEIKDIKKIFSFLVAHTKEGIIFEGNGDGDIDTDEFYQEVFRPYNFSSIKFLGHSQSRPAYILKR